MAPTWHDALPWTRIFALEQLLRKTLFITPRPEGTYLYVPSATTDELRPLLGRSFFRPNDKFSYFERGEDLNLARTYYDERPVDGVTYRWWQDHVRGWDQPDGSSWYHPHDELTPQQNPKGHIDGIGFNEAHGFTTLEAVLENHYASARREWTRPTPETRRGAWATVARRFRPLNAVFGALGWGVPPAPS